MLHLDLLYHLYNCQYQTVGESLCDGTHSLHALFPLPQQHCLITPRLLPVNSFKQEKEEEECSYHISMVTQVWVDQCPSPECIWAPWSPCTHQQSPYRGLALHTAPGRVRRTSLPLETLSGAEQTSPKDVCLGWQIPGINVSQQMTTSAESCLKVLSKQYTVHRGVLAPSGSRLQKGKAMPP